MTTDASHSPRPVPQVMVSSTFTDLKEHRAALIESINGHGLHPRVMEHDSARLVDVIESSLQMVQVSAAYIGVISLKYGQTPEDAVRNPDKLSITELEFNEAQRLGMPVLLFVMGDKHQGTKDDFEKDPEKEKKLNAFRDRAKKIAPGSAVNRVYAVFNSLQEFKDKIGSSLNELSHLLASKSPVAAPAAAPSNTTPTLHSSIPTPPAFYAKPDYIGRHTFVGRTAQFQVLTDWAKPTDTTSILLFEAIGGNGKSMLTWEWTTNHAEAARVGHEPWAGRFWYSFYEKGAIMRDFCLHALHYMTQEPMETLEKTPMADLRTALLALLHARPWLLILDGLERVLVAYHRIDAAEVRDEEVNRPTDEILDRHPRDAIRDEDTDLLRSLAVARPSKLLISSRLIPRVLLNPSGLPLPGVRPLVLPGLDDADAERLFCEVCGIRGTSADIRYYLKTFCDNHPLVIGVLAGLINSPGPYRGHFDAWAAAPEYGAKLNLASLNLIQNRNHILRAAMDALEPASRQLISTLALLNDPVDYPTVAALNPHLPPEPEEVAKPESPEKSSFWPGLPSDEKTKRTKEFEDAVTRRLEYERAHSAWRNSDQVRLAATRLNETIGLLEGRGLLQNDGPLNRCDLHPVIRGIAFGQMTTEERELCGKRVIRYFSSIKHIPFQNAKTLDDLRPGLVVVQTMLRLGHFADAAKALQNGLTYGLVFNVEAYVESLSVFRCFFSDGWDSPPIGVTEEESADLAKTAAMALTRFGEVDEALAVFGVALLSDLKNNRPDRAINVLCNVAANLYFQRRLARSAAVVEIALCLATELNDAEHLLQSRIELFAIQSCLGDKAAAEKTWVEIGPNLRRRVWSRDSYDPGHAEWLHAQSMSWRDALEADLRPPFDPHKAPLKIAEGAAKQGDARITLRTLLCLRGAWCQSKDDWKSAESSFSKAVEMARQSGLADADSETGLALAKHHLGQLTGDAARSEAERLAGLRQPAHRTLAQLWLALGDRAKAEHHALAAYHWAWADGEPYVNRYELTKTTELLQQLNVPIPELPRYDPSKDEPFPWEADVRAAIEKVKAEKEAKRKV